MSRIDASFGVVLPTYAGDATSTPGAEEYWGLYDLTLNDDVTWERVTRFSREAESLGYTSLWSPDHFMLGKNGMTFEVWTALAAISQLTSKVKLGTWVTCNNYRNPALVAKMATSLAIMSRDRFILGYGAGWNQPEYESYGYKFSPAGERVDMLQEGLELVRGMIDKEKFTYTGKYYSVKDAVNNPKPAHPIRLALGGWGKRVLALAAQYADEWDVGSAPTYAEYQDKIQFVRSELKKNGRSQDAFLSSMGVHVLVAENDDELREKKRRVMNVINILNSKMVRLPSADYSFDLEKAIVGTPAKVRELLKRYADLGCQRFELMLMDYPKYNSLELFSSAVM